MRSRMPLLLALLLVAACEHPIAVVTPHIEAADVLVHEEGAPIARTAFNRSWDPESLVLRDGAPRRITIVPVDFRGVPIDVAARADLSFRMEAEDGALLQWEPQRGFGWLRPFGAGTTRVRFLVWHETHADFVTPWLTVRVLPAVAPSSGTPEP